MTWEIFPWALTALEKVRELNWLSDLRQSMKIQFLFNITFLYTIVSNRRLNVILIKNKKYKKIKIRFEGLNFKYF
jgi:hypothetical protein